MQCVRFGWFCHHVNNYMLGYRGVYPRHSDYSIYLRHGRHVQRCFADNTDRLRRHTWCYVDRSIMDDWCLVWGVVDSRCACGCGLDGGSRHVGGRLIEFVECVHLRFHGPDWLSV